MILWAHMPLLLVSIVWPSFLFDWGKSYQALFVYPSQTSDRIYVTLCPILLIIVEFFTQWSCVTNCTHSIFRTRTIEARASVPHFHIEINSPLDGIVRLGHSAVMQGNNGLWETCRKRCQNHFRLHFTSKTPYSFKLNTRGILSTPACDVHCVRLKTTTGKAIRKRFDLDKQSILAIIA